MKKILVIRKFDEFSQILAENDFEMINLPLIETKPLADLRDFEAKLKTPENYDAIFLTSQNAARILAEKIDELNVNFSGKIYVLGRRSFEILKNKNLDLVLFEEANTAEEMLAKISPKDLENKSFLFVRGEKSLRVVPEFVGKLAKIEEIIVYQTRNISAETDKIKLLRELSEKREIAAACFFSPSAGESFIEQFGAEILHQTTIATIGKTTAEFFERQNVTVDFVSPRSNVEDFAVELVKHLEKEMKPQIFTDKHG